VVAFGWVHRAAHFLGEQGAGRAAGVRQQLGGLLGAMRAGRRAAGRLAGAVDHFIKVTRSYWPGLFACYEVEGLPRTNNELEQFFGRHRYHERRARGGKQGSPSLVLRGPARLLAASATRQRTYGVWELAQADPARCAELRAELEARRQRRVQRRRFRRDPEGFLRSLEEEFLKRTLPS
jgi:hypothetical protein